MKDSIEAYLKENIDIKASIKPWRGKNDLPLSLVEKYDFYQVDLFNEACILVEIQGEAPRINDMIKHMRAIQKHTNGTLVFLFKSISHFKRKSLIENKIPFIVENGQMYLPFLGLKLKNATKEQTKQIKKFASSTQLVFLYFLYRKELKINATELAKIMDVTNMTAIRTLNELYALGLLTYEVGGKTRRSKEYQRIQDPDYYRKGSEYLKNPISNVVYIEQITEKFLVAGLEALSNISMINPPNRPVRAISKAKARMLRENFIRNRDKIEEQNVIEIQIWDYDPDLLSSGNQVDIVSLAMSMSDIKDDRVELAIEERLRGESWYTE